jgi:transmembrane sensor
MGQDDKIGGWADERLRRQAARWFARLRGPDADKHRRAFEAWRAADPRRRAVYERLTRRWEEAGVLNTAQTQRPEGAARVARRVHRPRRVGWSLAGLAMGAAVVVLAISPGRPSWLDASPIPALGSQRIATRIGEIRTLRLSDGSAVILDTDTLLATHFSSSARRLNLVRGRARFDVAHDPGRPFVVTAGGGSVAARGTLFDVSVSPDQRVAVTLIRGVVEVQSSSDLALRAADRRPTARLAAGQQFAFGRSVEAPRIQPAAPGGALWPSGLLTFESAPLSEAVAQANRYSRRPIVLASPRLGSLKVSGVFKATASQEFAESVAAIFDLHLENGPDDELVLDQKSAPTQKPDPP